MKDPTAKALVEAHAINDDYDFETVDELPVGEAQVFVFKHLGNGKTYMVRFEASPTTPATRSRP